MSTHRREDPQLTVGEFVLHAEQSDDEIRTILETLTWTWSPLTGLSGGELGWLARDIRAGRAEIPGRTRYQSSELVHEAFRAAYHRHRRLTAELDKIARKHWWAQNGLTVALSMVVIGLLIAAWIFHAPLYSYLTELQLGTSQQQESLKAARPVYDAFGTYVIPGLIGLGLLAACAWSTARLLR